MTYGEMKTYVLQLLNQYSVEGREVPPSYNCQADDLNRIPALTRDGLYYITTTVRRLRTTAELAQPEPLGDRLLFELPEDFFQMAGGLLKIGPGGEVCRVRDYQMLGGRQILLPQCPGCSWVVEYFRYPAVCSGIPREEDFLDCPAEAQSALAFYVAAHVAMEDNNFLYGALLNEFERKMLRLQEGVLTDCGPVADSYGEA